MATIHRRYHLCGIIFFLPFLEIVSLLKIAQLLSTEDSSNMAVVLLFTEDTIYVIWAYLVLRNHISAENSTTAVY